MKNLKGFVALLGMREMLPRTGWIFVEKKVDTIQAESLRTTVFYIPESKEDEFEGEDNLATLVEIPIFLAILELREKTLAQPEAEDYLAALIHYLEFDDFLE